MASAPPAGVPLLSRQDTDALVRSNEDRQSERTFAAALVELKVPPGLAAQLAQDDQRVGKRIYLLDNSGSMAEGDGSTLLDAGRGTLKPVDCSRWEELCALVRDHARWNVICGTPCEFVLLNSPRGPGQPPVEDIDYICCHDDKGGVDTVEKWLQKTGPRGVTPLSLRLQEIRTRIHLEAQDLAAKGQMVFLTIVTDGLPTSTTSGESTKADRDQLATELRLMCGELPVQLVIRLCTNDDSVVDFYGNLDQDLELPMDVLDDIAGEAAELKKLGNDWFVYTPLLHRIREAGTLSKVFDNLDEKRLTKAEVRNFASLLLVGESDKQSLRLMDEKAFAAKASSDARGAPPVYDPATKKLAPYLNESKMRKALGLSGGLLSCFAWCS